MINKSILVFVILLLVGCHSKKSVIVTKKDDRYNSNKYQKSAGSTFSKTSSNTSAVNGTVNEYIANYKDVAMSNMKKYGIPSSIILAQGILESGAGQGTLAITANNHFGIKCHNDWKGESVLKDDDAAQECFRKYNDPSESFEDHATFLTGRNRYASLFDLPKDDYEAWAKGLRLAGYATDPNYPQKLISYIERYELYQYDSQVLGKKYAFRKKTMETTPIADNQSQGEYEVQKGDTLFSIAKKFNLNVEEVKQKNNMMDNTLYVGQRLRLK
jgi:flagellum-specific peptidoglycan hydrolase FlgJ